MVYTQANTCDLGIDDNTEWQVRSCKPRFRLEQVASGLCKLEGVSDTLGRSLAERIPADEFPVCIESVIKYCCKNYCKDCKGARLYGGVEVPGFTAIPVGKRFMITLDDYKNPKSEHCEWRLSKRRLRNPDGKLSPIGNMHRHVPLYLYLSLTLNLTPSPNRMAWSLC